MAFPAIQDADTKTGTENVGGTSHTITYCTNIASGDLLIFNLVIQAAGTVTGIPSGWTQIVGGATSPRTIGYYKIADGTETGTFSLTTSDSEFMVWQMLRITGWHGTSAPEASTQATGTSTAPDAASLSPSWGSADTLWLTVCAYAAGGSITVSAYPTNYTNGTNQVSSGASGPGLGVARRNNTTATEDAGAFTISSSAVWRASTIAVRPAAAAAVTAKNRLLLLDCGRA